MAAAGFLPTAAPMRAEHLNNMQGAHALSALGKRDDVLVASKPKPIGTPPSPTFVLMRHLPTDMTEQSLRLMFVLSDDLSDLQLLADQKSPDPGYLAAMLKFNSYGGALEAKNKLNGKPAMQHAASNMSLEIISQEDLDPSLSERFSATSSTTSSASGSRDSSRINGRLHSIDHTFSPIGSGLGSHDLAKNDSSAPIENLFSRQPPIGSQRGDRNGPSSKALINGDSGADEETSNIMWNPMAFANNGVLGESGTLSAQRRATAPQIPHAAMANLSLNTSMSSQPASLPPYSGTMSGHPALVSPVNTTASPMPFPNGGGLFNHRFPAVNPADQNPPCNTLYVGNLPIDTSEEELKATFSKARGYKRLCFRTKANGPMCFVEFEDISFATKALHDLYGHCLHNSTKGGIRLSFSKNPLGVRSGHGHSHANPPHMGSHQNHMLPPGQGSSFSTTNGPPPGLSAPPGLSNSRGPYHSNSQSHGSFQSFGNGRNGGWNRAQPNDAFGVPQNNYQPQSASSNYLPPQMFGR